MTPALGLKAKRFVQASLNPVNYPLIVFENLRPAFFSIGIGKPRLLGQILHERNGIFAGIAQISQYPLHLALDSGHFLQAQLVDFFGGKLSCRIMTQQILIVLCSIRKFPYACVISGLGLQFLKIGDELPIGRVDTAPNLFRPQGQKSKSLPFTYLLDRNQFFCQGSVKIFSSAGTAMKFSISAKTFSMTKRGGIIPFSVRSFKPSSTCWNFSFTLDKRMM